MKGWSRWVRFLDGREPGLTLALFRILTGAALLLNLGQAMAGDVVDLIWVSEEFGGYRDMKGPWLVGALGGPSRGVVWSLILVTFAAGVSLTLGLWGRISALVAAQGLLAITMINDHSKGSYDALLGNMLWLLVLADSTATWSLSCKLRSGRWTSDRTVPWWPRGLAIFQLAVVYSFSAMHKLSAAWTPAGGFSALYYILQQPSWQRWEMEWLAWAYPVTQAMTASVWLFEITFPVVILWMLARTLGPSRRWARWLTRYDLRHPFVFFGISMHLGIAALMEVGPFSLIAIALYPCAYRPEELAGAGRWLRARAGLG